MRIFLAIWSKFLSCQGGEIYQCHLFGCFHQLFSADRRSAASCHQVWFCVCFCWVVFFFFPLKSKQTKKPHQKNETPKPPICLGVLSLNGAEGLQQATSFAGISFGLKGIIHAVTQSTMNFQFVTVFPCLLPFVHQPN